MKKQIYKISQIIFNDGISLFIPFICLYNIFFTFNLYVKDLKNLFYFFLILVLVLYLIYFYFHKNKKSFLIFFIIFVFFSILGPFLEFPSDTWEHFYRIFRWNGAQQISDHEVSSKFAYFFMNVVVGEFPIEFRRYGLHVLSGFWQTLLIYHFYKLLISFKLKQKDSVILTILFSLLFGSNLFGFLRYYSISSTPLAFIAWLNALRLLNLGVSKKSLIINIILMSYIAYWNHLQELIFIAIGVGVYFSIFVYNKYKIKYKYLLYSIAIVTFLFIIFKAQITQNYKMFSEITWFGSYPIWRRIPYLETFGMHGVLGVVFSIIYYKKYKILSILTLTPFFIMIFPITALTINFVFPDYYTTYRIFYFFPSFIMFYFGVKELYLKFNKQIFLKYITIFLFLFICFCPFYPIRGRGLFQFYLPNEDLTLRETDKVASWILTKYQSFPKCRVVTDALTNYVLNLHFSNKLLGIRNHDEGFIKSWDRDEAHFLHQLLNTSSCMVVVYKNREDNYDSWVQKYSHHWSNTRGSLQLQYTESFLKKIKNLEYFGWTKYEVSPNFDVWTHPDIENLKNNYY